MRADGRSIDLLGGHAAEAAPSDAPYGDTWAVPIRKAGSQRTPVGGYPLSSISVTPVAPWRSLSRSTVGRGRCGPAAARRQPSASHTFTTPVVPEPPQNPRNRPSARLRRPRGYRTIPPGDDASAPAAPERKKGRCRGWSRQRPLPGMEKSGNDNRIRSTVARHRDPEPDAEGGRGDRNRR